MPDSKVHFELNLACALKGRGSQPCRKAGHVLKGRGFKLCRKAGHVLKGRGFKPRRKARQMISGFSRWGRTRLAKSVATLAKEVPVAR